MKTFSITPSSFPYPQYQSLHFKTSLSSFIFSGPFSFLFFYQHSSSAVLFPSSFPFFNILSCLLFYIFYISLCNHFLFFVLFSFSFFFSYVTIFSSLFFFLTIVFISSVVFFICNYTFFFYFTHGFCFPIGNIPGRVYSRYIRQGARFPWQPNSNIHAKLSGFSVAGIAWPPHRPLKFRSAVHAKPASINCNCRCNDAVHSRRGLILHGAQLEVY